MALRDDFARDGFVFLRGLLPAARVEAVRNDVLGVLDALGWIDGDRPVVPPVNEGDDLYFPMYTEVQRLESFHRLGHSPELVDTVRALLQEADLLVHPRKIARVNFPSSDFATTAPHQDYVFVQGSTDVITAWVPLGAVDRERGGLKLLPGSHTGALRATRPSHSVGGLRVDADDDDPAWSTIDYEPGDVVVFHSLTVHAAQPNRSGRLRLSADFRYQAASEPVATGSLLPHFHPRIPRWDELTKDWSGIEAIAVPDGLQIHHGVQVDDVRLATPSRFV
jgi:hypothetical protein